MTEHVQVPEAAVEAVRSAIRTSLHTYANGDGDLTIYAEELPELVTDVLTAALPYLVPAGDGGLRKALERLAEEWRYKGEFGWGPWQAGEGPDPEGAVLDDAAAEVRKLLAAHPAEHAVPQPVDREAIVRALSEHKQGLQPSGARCSCGWTERPYGSLLWTPDEWRDHLADAVLALLGQEKTR